MLFGCTLLILFFQFSEEKVQCELDRRIFGVPSFGFQQNDDSIIIVADRVNIFHFSKEGNFINHINGKDRFVPIGGVHFQNGVYFVSQPVKMATQVLQNDGSDYGDKIDGIFWDDLNYKNQNFSLYFNPLEPKFRSSMVIREIKFLTQGEKPGIEFIGGEVISRLFHPDFPEFRKAIPCNGYVGYGFGKGYFYEFGDYNKKFLKRMLSDDSVNILQLPIDFHSFEIKEGMTAEQIISGTKSHSNLIKAVVNDKFIAILYSTLGNPYIPIASNAEGQIFFLIFNHELEIIHKKEVDKSFILIGSNSPVIRSFSLEESESGDDRAWLWSWE